MTADLSCWVTSRPTMCLTWCSRRRWKKRVLVSRLVCFFIVNWLSRWMSRLFQPQHLLQTGRGSKPHQFSLTNIYLESTAGTLVVDILDVLNKALMCNVYFWYPYRHVRQLVISIQVVIDAVMLKNFTYVLGIWDEFQRSKDVALRYAAG